MGAISHLTKPVTREKLEDIFKTINGHIDRSMKELLVLEDDQALCAAIVELIGNGDVHTQTVGTGKEALDILKRKKIDCVVLDLGLPDMTGFDFIDIMGNDPDIADVPMLSLIRVWTYR